MNKNINITAPFTNGNKMKHGQVFLLEEHRALERFIKKYRSNGQIGSFFSTSVTFSVSLLLVLLITIKNLAIRLPLGHLYLGHGSKKLVQSVKPLIMS